MPEEMTIQAAMDGFLLSLNSPHTLQAYATPLRHFVVFLGGQGIHAERDSATSLNVDHAIGFVPWLRHVHFPEPGRPAKATLQLYLTAVYRFYRSLLKRGVALEAAGIARLEETFRDARNIRGEPRPKDPKLEAVLATIRAARSIPPVTGKRSIDRQRELSRLRDIAIVETLRSSGCRVGELVALRRGDVDWLAHSALVKGKGSKYRKVYLDDPAWRALKAYLLARGDGEDARALARLPLYCGHGNRSGHTPSLLTTRHVARTIQALVRKAGIAEVGVTPHYFRHVFATRALDRTENLALVQDMMGHASPATTRVYAKTNERQRREGYARVWDEDALLSERRDSLEAVSAQGHSYEAAVSVLDAVLISRRDADETGVDQSTDLMYTAVLQLLAARGGSLSELISLRLADLDPTARAVRVSTPAGSHTAHLDDRAWDALSAYLDVRPSATPGGFLFCEDDGTELTAEGAYAQLWDLAERSGMGRDDLYLLL